MANISRNRKKKTEIFLIRSFVTYLGYQIANPQWIDSPDALLTLLKGKARKRVAIEHTEYFNDVPAGTESPLSRVVEFWPIVQTSLLRRLSHRKHLTGHTASIRFGKSLALPKKYAEWKLVAREFAKELIDYSETLCLRLRESSYSYNHELKAWPNLHRMCFSLRIKRWPTVATRASRHSWTCSNITAGHIGLNLGNLESAIATKNQKALKYAWQDASEKWLLISASGATPSNHSGSPDPSDKWDSSSLRALCHNSPFDKIVFWERVRDWHKWIKPDRLAKRGIKTL